MVRVRVPPKLGPLGHLSGWPIIDSDAKQTAFEPSGIAGWCRSGSSQDEGIQSIPEKEAMSKKKVTIDIVVEHFDVWLQSRLTILRRGTASGSPSFGGTPSPGREFGRVEQNRRCTKAQITKYEELDQPRALSPNCSAPSSSFTHLTFGTSEPGDINHVQSFTEFVPPTYKLSDENKARGFACPFLKHNPGKYRTWRSCTWAGWPTVHRVKEHIYRKHMLPKYRCNRCRQDFKSGAGLSDHQRSEISCSINLEMAEDGVDETRHQLLRSRKGSSGRSEEEKWIKVYVILFPGDSSIPSSYHDVDFQVSKDQPTADEQYHGILKNLESYARHELPKLMRPRLEEILCKTPNEGLHCDNVTNVAQDVLRQIFQTFKPPAGFVQMLAPQARDAAGAGSLFTATSVGTSDGPSLTNVHLSRDGSNGTDWLLNQDLGTVFEHTVIDPLQSINFPFDDIFSQPTLQED